MEICIIDKLLLWDRVGDFYAQVIEAQSDLRCGLLRNPREVEVKLAADGRVSHEHQNYRFNLMTISSPVQSITNTESASTPSVMMPCSRQLRVGPIATMPRIWTNYCLYYTNYRKNSLQSVWMISNTNCRS